MIDYLVSVWADGWMPGKAWPCQAGQEGEACPWEVSGGTN